MRRRLESVFLCKKHLSFLFYPVTEPLLRVLHYSYDHVLLFIRATGFPGLAGAPYRGPTCLPY